MAKIEVKKPEKKEVKRKIKPILLLQQKRTHLTIGQRAADKLSLWAGSWAFIVSFLVFLAIWMAINVYGWIKSWDPYPFILLNLVLSCLAALQAPIILMSQNRAAERDRQRAEYDYAVNRKAEREIQTIKKIITRTERKIYEMDENSSAKKKQS